MTEHERSRHSRRIQAAPGEAEAKQIGSGISRGVLAAVSALALAVMGIGYMTVGNLNDGLAQADNLNLGNQADGATDILLVGVDSRTDAKGNPLSQKEIDMLRAGEEDVTNTDTMILIRIPNDGSSATAVSLPRDTYVNTRDYGNMKLNGVYGTAKFEKTQELTKDSSDKDADSKKPEIEKKSTEAGRQALISSVADLTGITVDRYAEVGLLGFVLLTDAVGGVDVCLKNKVDEPLSGAKFKAGRQTLNGQNALSFVRQRHELPRGDLDRITRQQAYMASLASKVLSSKTLTDPGSMSKLNDAVQRSVVLDSGWDVMGLATQMQNMAGGDVSFQTIPVTSIDGTGDYGESVVTVDTEQVHGFFEELLGDKPGEDKTTSDKPADITDYKAKDYKVNVFNASEQTGLAGRVADLTKQYGYKSGKVGNHPETGVSESQVNAKNPDDPAARALAKQLGGLHVVKDSSLDEHELSVTLSGTYSGPGILEQSAPLTKPDDPTVGTLTEGIKDLDGDGIPDDESTSSTGTDSTGSSDKKSSTVGTPGSGEGIDRKDPIDASGDGPMCVN